MQRMKLKTQAILCCAVVKFYGTFSYIQWPFNNSTAKLDNNNNNKEESNQLLVYPIQTHCGNYSVNFCIFLENNQHLP